jgi:hypothetical protein
MGTFTKEFASADDYEEWLKEVGERVHVLTISNVSMVKNLSAPRNVPSGARTRPPVIIKYETKDKSLAPQRSRLTSVLQIVAVGVVFWVLFIYAVKLLM